MTSIVIPAHNEAAVIRRCVESILADARPGEFELIVAANGCTDGTEAIVESIPGATLLRVAKPSKVAALNAADELAGDNFPRLYVDADVTIDTAGTRAVAAALEADGPILAAAPAIVFDVDSCSWIVKQYYDIWTQLPWISQGVFGSGFYALSRSGRGRFDAFQETFAEDMWVRDLFTPAERASISQHTFTVSPPLTVASLVKVRTRIHLANRLYFSEKAPTSAPGQDRFALLRLLRQPKKAPGVLIYFGITGLAKVRAKRQEGVSGKRDVWIRDDTARSAAKA